MVTPPHSRRSPRQARRIVVTALATAAILASLPSAAQAFGFGPPVTTLSASGAPGRWYSAAGNNNCAGTTIQSAWAAVTGSPWYPNSYQNIWYIPRLDQSTDGTNWSNGVVYGTWQNGVVGGTQARWFGSQTMSVPRGGPRYYRVSMLFYWYVYGTGWVGNVTDAFDSLYNWDGYAWYGASNSTAQFCLKSVPW